MLEVLLIFDEQQLDAVTVRSLPQVLASKSCLYTAHQLYLAIGAIAGDAAQKSAVDVFPNMLNLYFKGKLR